MTSIPPRELRLPASRTGSAGIGSRPSSPDLGRVSRSCTQRSSSGKARAHVVEQALALARAGADIDWARLGEGEGGYLAHQAMGTVVGNLARTVRKLAAAGMRRFVVVADQGYIFTAPKEDAMKVTPPSGETVEVHRRVWIGRGGDTPPGCVRVSSVELGYRSDLDFVFPRGAGVFTAGGGLAYHHGGPSLQELVIPVLTARMGGAEERPAGEKVVLSDVPERITNRIIRVQVRLQEDLFTEPVWVRVSLVSGRIRVRSRCGPDSPTVGCGKRGRIRRRACRFHRRGDGGVCGPLPDIRRLALRADARRGDVLAGRPPFHRGRVAPGNRSQGPRTDLDSRSATDLSGVVLCANRLSAMT